MASIHDWKCYRLPLIFTVTGAVLSLSGYSFFVGIQAIQACLTSFLMLKGAQIFCRHFYKKECLGSGDCLLALSLGGMLSGDPELVGPALVTGTIAGIVYSSLQERKKIPFGPFITAGFFSVLLTF